jgi:hypothetical protein
MKTYKNKSNKAIVYFEGVQDEMKKEWNRLLNNEEHNYLPIYGGEFPVFNDEKKLYVICVNNDDFVSVVNSDVFQAMISDGEVEEVTLSE